MLSSSPPRLSNLVQSGNALLSYLEWCLCRAADLLCSECSKPVSTGSEASGDQQCLLHWFPASRGIGQILYIHSYIGRYLTFFFNHLTTSHILVHSWTSSDYTGIMPAGIILVPFCFFLSQWSSSLVEAILVAYLSLDCFYKQWEGTSPSYRLHQAAPIPLGHPINQPALPPADHIGKWRPEPLCSSLWYRELEVMTLHHFRFTRM